MHIIRKAVALVAAAGLVVVGHAFAGEKISICHATGSVNNPYVYITISVNGLHGHDGHAGDLIPAPNPECNPLPPPPPPEE